MAKINVKSCEFKEDKGDFKIYHVIDTDGKKYVGFEEYTVGEHEVTIIPKDPYPPQIKRVKTTTKGGFPVKDYTFDKRKLALEIAIRIDNKMENLLTNAEKIEYWLRRP